MTEVQVRPRTVRGVVLGVRPGAPVRREPSWRDAWARQPPVCHPHPCATAEQNRRVTFWDVLWADQGVQWLCVTGIAGAEIRGRCGFWWLVGTCVPLAAVALWRNYATLHRLRVMAWQDDSGEMGPELVDPPV